MASYSNVYTGVFISFPEKKVEKKKVTLISPMTGKGFKEGEAEFCPSTGMKLKEKIEIETEYKRPFTWEVKGYEDDETFSSAASDWNVFLLNISSRYAWRLDTNGDVCITHDEPLVIIEEFINEYQDYLDACSEYWGEQVEVKYGTITFLY